MNLHIYNHAVTVDYKLSIHLSGTLHMARPSDLLSKLTP